jgi:hypothetical protein
VGSLDLPDQPDVPGRAIRADAGGSGRDAHAPRELPDPDERGRAYEATLRHVSAETPAEASPAQRADAGDQRSYRDDVPRFHDMRADHERRWPETPHATADRPGDRPELPAATAGAVDRIRDAARTFSPDAQVIQQENKQGGRLEGFEHRLNGEDRLQEKVPAETAEEDAGGQLPDTADQRSYWDEVPRFRELWAKHERDWPAGQRPTPDRSADLPGSYRSDGGFYLNPERHAETIAAIGRVRETEPAISADVRTTEQDNKYGGWLEGFDRRLKGEDRLKEKVAEEIASIGPDARPEEILAQIPDAIRYTFCLRPEAYTRGYYDIKARLENLGYEMYQSTNYWIDPEYKGINTRWVTPDGQRFEIQLHTPESFHAKQHVTHRAYERIRNPLTRDTERPELEDFQREVSLWIHVPEGATEIPDFRKEGF